MKNQIAKLSRNILTCNNIKYLTSKRCLSTKEAIERRNHIFTLEKKRQHEEVGRIEKIEVQYKGLPEACTMVMNKDISTPYDCAKHLTEWHMDSSALAFIDGIAYWDMHRPLADSCTLEFLDFQSRDPSRVNQAFWKTCSFMLGACASVAFKDKVTVKPHSFPPPNIKSGSFVYDIDLPTLPDWKPSLQEMYTLSAEYVKLIRQKCLIERLDVSEELALEMFIENEHKTKQIPEIARKTGRVTLYRAGKHVDISGGPLLSHTAQIGRAFVSAVHKMQGGADSEVKQLYRFQGVALPHDVRLNHFAWGILTERAKKLNLARNPINMDGVMETMDKETFKAKASN